MKKFLTICMSFLMVVTAAVAGQAEKSYDIRSYGAVPDGKTVNTVAIQKAIDEAHAAGGGCIVVDGGEFMTGALFFKNGVDLEVKKGAMLTGTTNQSDYPIIATRFEGIEVEHTCALLNFDDSPGVRVFGEGTINGNGLAWPQRRRAPQQQQQQAEQSKTVMEQLAQGANIAQTMGSRPRLLCFTNCPGGEVRDLLMLNQSCWCLHILYTDGFTVDNLEILAEAYIPSSDGIDIDSSKNVVVRNTDISVYDDCISIKSGKGSDGRRVGRPSEDIIIENCNFNYGHGGVAMGSEISGGIRNVIVRNCVMGKNNSAPIRFKSQPSRGGVVENITFENIILEGCQCMLECNMMWRMQGEFEPPAEKLSELRNIRLINVDGEVRVAGAIAGFDTEPMAEKVFFFEDCDVKAEYGISLRHTRQTDFSGLNLTVKNGEPIYQQGEAPRVSIALDNSPNTAAQGRNRAAMQGAPAAQQQQRRPDYRPVSSENVNVAPQVEAEELRRTQRPEAGSSRKGDNPVVFMIGDSTMRTGTKGNADNGQRGWGYYAEDLFDTERISVENHAMGGTSSRTFYDRLWADVVKGVKPGDWMIIQIGHNDSGPYDTARSRNSIPGTGKESIEVVNETNGEKSTVYSYGEYIRRYVNETREHGGKPVLLSLTPRDKWNEDGTLIRYNVDSYTPWLKSVAAELDVPFLDFNNAGSDKYEHVYDKKKVSYMFFSDNIHTSDFGARDNLETFETLLRASDIELKNYLLPEVTHSSAVRVAGRPVLFLVGDGTMGGDKDSFGWGASLKKMLDGKKISVDDRTQADLGTRTYLEAGHWDAVYESVQEGDYVLIQFGYDESGDINVGEARGVLDGNGDEKQVMLMERTGRHNGIYTYGFYIRKYCMDIIEKGATPIVLSYVPVLDESGTLVGNAKNYGAWAREAAEAAGALFIDLNGEAIDEMNDLSAATIGKLFVGSDRLSKKGAALMAEVVRDEIDDLDCPLETLFK